MSNRQRQHPGMFSRAVVVDRARRPTHRKQCLGRRIVKGKMGTAFQVTVFEAHLRQDGLGQGLVLRFTVVGGATQRQLLRSKTQPVGHPIVHEGDGLERFVGRSIKTIRSASSTLAVRRPLESTTATCTLCADPNNPARSTTTRLIAGPLGRLWTLADHLHCRMYRGSQKPLWVSSGPRRRKRMHRQRSQSGSILRCQPN